MTTDELSLEVARLSLFIGILMAATLDEDQIEKVSRLMEATSGCSSLDEMTAKIEAEKEAMFSEYAAAADAAENEGGSGD